SYNPPNEYLLSEKEKELWTTQHPEDRNIDFLPQKNEALRRVSAYNRFIKERYTKLINNIF
ncbi:unnamed protein product, partial [marine sediment metagenome]